MRITNTSTVYGSVTKWFHWGMAVLFVFMFTLAYIMTDLPKSPFKFTLYDLHKATGLLLFGLVTLRLFWRCVNPKPHAVAGVPAWQIRLADWNIIALYCLMFLMPMSGFLASTLSNHTVSFYGIFTIPAITDSHFWGECFDTVHTVLSYLIIFCVSIHVLGALYHHYVRKDETLKRML